MKTTGRQAELRRTHRNYNQSEGERALNRVKHTVLSACFFFGLISVTLGQSHSRHCTQEPVTTETRWGGNERIVLDLRDKPTRTLKGVVLRWPGEAPSKTLVQVFHRKPSDPLSRPSDQENAVPVAACVTGDDGTFAFSLPSGEYELRMSQKEDMDVTSVIVTVKRGLHRARKIKVLMQAGT